MSKTPARRAAALACPEDPAAPVRPATRDQLRRFVAAELGLNIPDRSLCPGHNSPMDYLWHSFNADFAAPPAANGDCVVWANRGGGKTQLAAVATLLEGLFKPGCQTRLLAGSRDQAHRMYDYLAAFLQDDFAYALDGRLLTDACRFTNGAKVEVLPQSAPAIRGRHIHKLRCDEMELFNPDLFAAAQFVTRSGDGLRAAMEMFSTFHRPWGLMQQILQRADEIAMPTFRWCMWEVIEPCPPDRSCSRCPLSNDCRGIARRADGYLTIDDCISRMRRSSRAGFEAEMLCLRPTLENAVFAEFDPAVHVAPAPYQPALPLYRTIDFGYVNPFVCLWIQADDDGRVFVIDEYIQRRKPIVEHAEEVKRRTPCPESRVAGTYCDPAGSARSDITGTSTVRELAEAGVRATHRASRIYEGIEKIRAALRSGDAASRLVIDPRCTRTIEALRCYHYPDAGAKSPSELPDKDGLYDHPIDALRYFFINHPYAAPPRNRHY